ncbi:hypothetical protein [Nostoc sp. T09]|uniref:hypothetical protein n=1 Tax=Nostoc sp. T09 TaxID=1932621 RepID=UPI0015C4EB33|nr:hypothetical protein [Nostoc sp. T09]
MLNFLGLHPAIASMSTVKAHTTFLFKKSKTLITALLLVSHEVRIAASGAIA